MKHGICVDCGNPFTNTNNRACRCDACQEKRERELTAIRRGLPNSVRVKIIYEAGKCNNCGEANIDLLTIDHIKPISKGGTNDLENPQVLCVMCNHRKWTK